MSAAEHAMDPRPGWGRVARAVGKVTLLEILRDKILYNILLVGVLVQGVGFLAARLSYSQPLRIVLSVGLSGLSLSLALIAILNGAHLLAREFERRTVYVALSRPITKGQFLFGKFCGIAAVLSLNWALLVGALLLIAWPLREFGVQSLFHPSFLVGMLLLLLQSWVLAALAMMFSAFSTTSLSVTITLGLFLIGNSITELRAAVEKLDSPASRQLFKLGSALLPNFEHFNAGFKAIYGLPLGWQFIGGAFLYASLLIAVALGLATLLIRAREV